MYDAFISHKKEDRDFAQLVERTCVDLEVQAYLDELDESIQAKRQDPKALTEHIEQKLGVSNSLMCLFTDETPRSTWVPFEIGFARGEGKGLAVLDGRETAKPLPEYLVGWRTIPVEEPALVRTYLRRGYRTHARQLMRTLLHGWALWLKSIRNQELAKAVTERLSASAQWSEPTGARRSDQLGDQLAAIYRREGVPLGPRF